MAPGREQALLVRVAIYDELDEPRVHARIVQQRVPLRCGTVGRYPPRGGMVRLEKVEQAVSTALHAGGKAEVSLRPVETGGALFSSDALHRGLGRPRIGVVHRE